MRFQIEFWFWAAVAAAWATPGFLTKRLWHLLFDDRCLEWHTTRAVNVWGSWHPYFGFGFNFYLEAIPPHTAVLSDERDISWGPELKLGFGLGWIDFGLLIPNDEHPDNEVTTPPRYCAECGMATEPMISDRCPGCDKLAVVCTCTKAEPMTGSKSASKRLMIGSDTTLRRTKS